MPNPAAGSAEDTDATDAGAKAQETDSEESSDADGKQTGESDSRDLDDASGTDSSEDAGAKKEKSSFFKKKKDKRDEQIEELSDKLRRQMAEFDNFRKRTDKEKSQMFDMGARTVIEKILPVVDNFERGFTMVDEADKDDAFVTGMDKVYKQLMTELEAIGVKAIEAEGKEFDPNLHNAVMQVENEELESGMVAQELQKGYKYKDTVVRHSMVSVVQ
ncbi:MAG: nucleotide exchange factor GrpE [Clostridiales bacterium]|nr:nucleotide exchange factor GrpE [Clostridiales bacterium]